MTATLLFVVLLAAWLAALGRGSLPRRERLPWPAMTVSDLARAVLTGCTVLDRLNARRPLNPILEPDVDRQRSHQARAGDATDSTTGAGDS